jgi:hypothetical protein
MFTVATAGAATRLFAIWMNFAPFRHAVSSGFAGAGST